MTLFTAILLVAAFKIITPAAFYSFINPLITVITDNFTFLQKLALAYTFPLIISLINSIIIPLAAYYLTLFERNWLKSDIELSVLYKNLLTMLFSTILIPLTANLELENISWEKIKLVMSNQSYYLIQYLIQVTLFSNMVQFLRIYETFLIFWYKIKVKVYFDFGYNYAFALVVLFIVVCFSPLIPILPFLGFLFFIVKYLVDKYILCYVQLVEFDSAGKLSLRCLYITFISLIMLEGSCLVVSSFTTKIFLGCCFVFFNIHTIYKTVYGGKKKEMGAESDFKIFVASSNKANLTKFQAPLISSSKRGNYRISSNESNKYSQSLTERNSDIFDKRELCWEFDPPEYIRDYIINVAPLSSK